MDDHNERPTLRLIAAAEPELQLAPKHQRLEGYTPRRSDPDGLTQLVEQGVRALAAVDAGEEQVRLARIEHDRAMERAIATPAHTVQGAHAKLEAAAVLGGWSEEGWRCRSRGLRDIKLAVSAIRDLRRLLDAGGGQV